MSLRAFRRSERTRIQTKDPKKCPTGWLFDPHNPDVMYAVGTHVYRDFAQRVTLAELVQEAHALRIGLAELYPGFDPKHILLEIDAYCAGNILFNPALWAQLKAKVGHFFSLDDGSEHDAITGLEMKIEEGEYSLTLRIAPCTYYEGYGFFVYGHPETANEGGQGLWCRPTPDMLARLSGEVTM